MTFENPIQTLVRDGVCLAYIDIGAGAPPLLFIHGWCCDRSHWREQVLEFQDRQRTVAVDLRGHGSSDKPDQDYAIGVFVDDVAWLCGKIGLDRPVVIGHSMGGVIGLNLVRQHPDLARALVMVDSPVIPLPDTLQTTADAVFAGLRSPAYKDVATSFVSTMMFGPQSPALLKERIIAGMVEAPQRVMSTALADLLTGAVIAEGPVGVPALYILAATSPWDPDAIKARYPNVQIERMPTGHFIQMEAPEALNDLLRRFIEEVA